MSKATLPVTAMFEELIRMGRITPPAHMEEMRLPGEFVSVPSITTYGIPDVPIRSGIYDDAKLGQYSQRDFAKPDYAK